MTAKNKKGRVGIIALAFIAMAMLMLISDASAAVNITVAHGTPSDAAYSSSTNLNFTFTPVSNRTIVNATIWSTWGDGSTWASNQTNVTTVTNATLNGINVSAEVLPVEGAYTWNVRVCDDLNACSTASANRTVTFDRTNPTVTQNALQSSLICVFTPSGTVTDTNKDDCSFTDSVDGTIAASLSGSTCTADAEVSASAGSHTILMTGTDLASNSANTAAASYNCQKGGGGGSSSSSSGGAASQTQNKATTNQNNNVLVSAPVQSTSNPIATVQNTIRTMANNLRVTILNITDAIKGLLGIH